MKNLYLSIIMLITVTAVSNSQLSIQNTGIAAEYKLFQNHPDPFEESTTIKFDTRENSYVKLFVENLQTGVKNLLVDGETGEGRHGIIFKSNSPLEANNNYKCTMEVYSLLDNILIFTSEIKMTHK